MEAERDLVALKGCQVMERHLGDCFDGTVSSVAPFGVFVELDEIFVEGLVPLASLQDDAYGFDEQRLCLIGSITGRELHLGDSMRVRVAAVRPERREIDFVPENFDETLHHRAATRRVKPVRGRNRRRQ